MTSPPIAMHTLQEIKTIDRGNAVPYVLRMPEVRFQEVIQPPQETICLAVLTRSEGILLCLPSVALPHQLVNSIAPIEVDSLIGPALDVNIPAMMVNADGSERMLEMEIPCLLADFHQAILPRLREFDPLVDGQSILCFLEGGLDVLPINGPILQTAQAWLEQHQEGRIAFYSAAEDAPVQDAASPAPSGRPKAAPKAAAPKRVSTASLSQQLGALTETIPAISSQLLEMQKRQDQFAELLLAKSTPPLPHRQGFVTPVPKHAAAASPMDFMSQVGPPPRVRAITKAASPLPVAYGEDEPALLPEEESFPVEAVDSGRMDVSMMLLKQQQALTSLVAHITTQDGLRDFGGASSSSTAISLKGSDCSPGEAAGRTGSTSWQLFPTGSSECIPQVETLGEPAELSCRVPREGRVHEVCGEAGRLLRTSEGVRTDHVALGSCRGSDDGRRHGGCPGDACFEHGGHRAELSRLGTLGSGLASCSARGTSSSDLFQSQLNHQSSSPCVWASMSGRRGGNGAG